MLTAQQVRPGQLTAVPGTLSSAQFDIGTLLSSIMPLVMLMMVMMMIMPMMKGMADAFKA